MSAPEAKPFDAPWQAQAFALTVHLNERGLFTWNEWAQALSTQLRAPDAAPDGGDYYDRWLKALETLLMEKGVTEAGHIAALADAWQRAANATPHGMPIRLENDPIAPA